MQRDDIYLIDMWRLLRREWLWFVAVFVAMLLATFTFLSVTRPQWQANAWIQIGQVDTAPAGQDPKVEPLQRVLERLQLIPFQNQILQSIGIASNTPDAGLYRKSLKIEPLPYAGPLVKLTVRGHSAQQAKQFAEATVAQLQTIHRGLETTQLTLARQRLDEVQRDVQNVMAERDRLQQAVTQNKDTFAGLLLASKNEELIDLQQTRSDLLGRLSATYTYETSLMWPVYVPEHPAFPNPFLTWGMGVVAGLFLGVVAAVGRNALRRRAVVASHVQHIVERV
ncbi:Wzz/FepE/Etk N-terminal domain-containing protein [Dyella nitratireducens]|uniref:Chain-length determining protein n=1 Tax=Dyella nitratireducens TaxID=1849580 RepID=A0ABQ1G8M7_9GAMM|nr:Wzz/FepE/Etk N-terminal domain-containing protein [Dyella nitratireducens]GGA38882.1 chain-length determining protein [Dyella nitratireducens]GLQ40372.1 chain-length determining protein [Dyella nitratireducens]